MLEFFIITLFLLINFGQPLFLSSRLKSRAGVFLNIGIHGEDFHYLPLYSPEVDANYPRILHIAGVYPGIRADELILPQSPPATLNGHWMYDFPEPTGPQLGIVALPGSENLSTCKDPIAIISKTSALGIPSREDQEVVIVVDRAERRYSPDEFFAFRNEESEVIMGWVNQEDLIQFEILGKIVMCALPKSSRNSKSSFLEEDEYD